MRRIRLLHVLEATVGGTRRHLLDLCLGLPTERFQQHVAVSVLRDARFREDIKELEAAGIEATILPMRREISPLSDARCLGMLRKLIDHWQPKIVHGHSSKGGFLARIAARLSHTRPRVVFSPHGFAFQMLVSPIRRRLYVGLERWAGRYTDRLVAACESQRRLALAERLVPPERIVVIPNGIKAADYQIRVDKKTARGQLELPEAAVLIGTVAALTPQKGIADLIRAIGAVRRERPEVQLAIAGDGPLRTSLQCLAKRVGLSEAVHFLGEQKDVPLFLRALDLFVLPSLWEGLPYALLEAGAAGLPVIATAIPGNTDVIEHEQTGLLAPPGDYFSLALMIFRALEEEALGTMAQALRERVERKYTLEEMISKHIALYEELVQA